MSQEAKPILRGFQIPDDRMAWWDAESGEYASNGTTRLASLASAGPLPGIPSTSSSTSMRLQAIGSQSARSSLKVRTQRGGFADGDNASGIWQRNGDTGWFGWDTPNLLTGFEPISWTNSSAGSCQFPNAVTTPDGWVVCVVQVGVVSGTPTIKAFRRAPTTGAWSSTTIYLQSTQSLDSHPCLVLLPSGRLLCFFWVNDESANTANIRKEYSDDGGASWTTGQLACLPTSIDTDPTVGAAATGYVPGRLRGAYMNGQLLLIAQARSNDNDSATHLKRDALWQYASIDSGSSLTLVYAYEADGVTAQGGNYQDILVTRGRFYIAYLDILTGEPTFRAITNAWEPFVNVAEIDPAPSTEPWGTEDAGSRYFVDGDLCLFADEAGNLFLTGRQVSVSHTWVSYTSRDGGTSWEAMALSSASSGAGKWWDTSDASTYPMDACATFQRGRGLIIHSHASNPAAYDESLSVSYLGGYSKVPMPGYEAVRGIRTQATWGQTWLPFDLPGDVGWTPTVSGTPTESIATGLLVTTCGSVETIVYSRTPSGSVANGLIAMTSVLVPSGEAIFGCRLGSVTEGFEVEVRVTHTTVSFYDAVSNTIVGSAATYAGGEVQLLVAMENNNAVVYYRLYDSMEERAYIEVGTKLTMTDDAAATFTTNRVQWGTASVAFVTRTHTWRMVGYVTDEGGSINYVGSNLTSFVNPSQLLGRPLSSSGTYIADGVSIRALEGPTERGDEWGIATRYQHPVSNLLPTLTPSRRQVWRSCPISELNASTAWLHLAWRIDTDGDGAYLSADCYMGNDLVAAYLTGLNCPQVKIDLYYGGAWNNVTTTGVWQFNGTRKGNTIAPTTTSTFGAKWRFDELAGCGMAVSPIGFVTTDWTGTIRHNTEGISNTNGVTTKTTTIFPDEVPAILAASPYVSVWPNRQLTVIHPSGFSNAVQGVRLRIPVSAGTDYPGNPAAGYFQIGMFSFGPVLVFGHEYSWQRNISIEANTELIDALDGSRRSRVRGPEKLTLEVAWADGVDVSSYRSETAPNYVMGSANAGAVPVAFADDMPLQLQDLVRFTHGPDRTLLYLPYVPYDSSSTSSGNVASFVTNFSAGAIYGRITSPVRIEQVLGDEEVDEVYRMTTVLFEEED